MRAQHLIGVPLNAFRCERCRAVRQGADANALGLLHTRRPGCATTGRGVDGAPYLGLMGPVAEIAASSNSVAAPQNGSHTTSPPRTAARRAMAAASGG